MPNTVNDSGNSAYSCAETVPSVVAQCRGAKREITAWLEQYGSEASDRLFDAMLHELLWLDLVPRREYEGDPRIQAEHAAHQTEIATAYAEWKR